MENPLRRALSDTRRSFGFTLAAGIRSVVVPATAVLLMVLLRGTEHAVNQAADIALYALAFSGAALIPVFLWNLWLAPYRSMNEQLEQALADAMRPSEGAERPPGPTDVSTYADTTVYRLGDAACLWVGVQPHAPISNSRAKAAFTRLSGAVQSGQLPGRGGWASAVFAFNGRTWWPDHDHPVSTVDLRRYAEQLDDVPAFLASVQIPKSDAHDQDAKRG